MSPIIKIQKHIEIVRSTTPGLISLDEATSRAIYKILRSHYATVGISIINNIDDLMLLVSNKPDLVFLGIKFVPDMQETSKINGSKIWVADLLEKHGIAYTGSCSAAQELAREKVQAKQRTLQAGVDTAPFCVIKRDEMLNESSIELKYPVFIKPTNRGGGYGIDNNSVAYNFVQLKNKVEQLSDKIKADSLVEEYLPGREFSIAVLENTSTSDYSIMPLELIAPINSRGLRFLSGEIKSADTEKFISVTDDYLRIVLTNIAREVFDALGATGYGRIDVRLGADNRPYFLEANLLPNLINNFGNFPKACLLNLNLGYQDMILRIVSLGLQQNIVKDAFSVEQFGGVKLHGQIAAFAV